MGNCKLLTVGRHRVIVKACFKGISQENNYPFYLLRFENLKGYIFHRFYTSDMDTIKLETLFKLFDLQVEFINETEIEMAIKSILHRTISLTVNDKNGLLTIIDWSLHDV